tara:strand:- start:392 stop:751 length:360 start_codon:yes stop_codon:yes gene_type:complete
MFNMLPKETPEVNIWLKDEDKITIKKFHFITIKTPGHTPGGTCFEIQNHLFVGDTLFRGSVGRTDLPGGDSSTLELSLIHLLNSVNHSSIVHSGHGPDTTIENELRQNPFLIPLKNQVN